MGRFPSTPTAWPVAALCAALGFGLVNGAVRALVPWPAEYGLRAKVEHLDAHPARYDVLVIGSSATYYGLRPRTFEAVLRERGRDLSVFNLGVGGMGSYEQVHLLRHVLASCDFDYVLYEEPRFDPLNWYVDVFNPRYRHWHDLDTTVAALRGLRFVDAPPSYKAEEYAARWHGSWRVGTALEHLALFAQQATALGAGPTLARAALGWDLPLSPTEAQLEDEAGWLDLSAEPDEGALRQHERFLADRAGWPGVLDRIRAQNDGSVDLEQSFDGDELARLERTLRDSGAEVVWFSSPRNVGDATIATLAREGRLSPFLAYNRPERVPDLYEPDVRWDSNHLAAEGAERWSRRFAADFADWLDARDAARGARD